MGLFTLLWFLLRSVLRWEIVFGVCLIPSFFITRNIRADANSLLPLLSGFLLALSVPDISCTPCAFIGFIPLFMALEKSPSYFRSLFYGAIAAFSAVFVSMSWIKDALVNICAITEFQGFLLLIPFSILLNLKCIFLSFVYHSSKQNKNLPRILFLSSAFAILELIKWEAYPWYMGVCFISFLPFIQIVDIIGLPGLSFIIILFNLSLFDIWKWIRKEIPLFPLRNSLAAGIVFLGLIVYGALRLHQIHTLETQSDESITVAAIQPDSPLKIQQRDTEIKQKVSDSLYALARKSVEDCKPDVLVFAEGATTIGYQADYNPEFKDTFNRIAQELQIPLIFDNIRFITGSIYYRSVILLSPEPKIEGEYLKCKLAPFGEYIPFESLFPGLRVLFKYAKNYQRGKKFTALTVNGITIIPQICFESIHPGFTRRFVKNTDGQIIFNLTNDKWFGIKEAYQHLALSRFRAIENRVPMVRTTNNGISAFISPAGNTIGESSPYDTAWVECRTMALPKIFSFYRECGDIFGYICCIILLVLIVKSKTQELNP